MRTPLETALEADSVQVAPENGLTLGNIAKQLRILVDQDYITDGQRTIILDVCADLNGDPAIPSPVWD